MHELEALWLASMVCVQERETDRQRERERERNYLCNLALKCTTSRPSDWLASVGLMVAEMRDRRCVRCRVSSSSASVPAASARNPDLKEPEDQNGRQSYKSCDFEFHFDPLS